MNNPMMVAPTKTVNYDDLMALGSDARVEVIDGEIREMVPVGGEHGFIGLNIRDAFQIVVSTDKLGFTMTDGLIYLMGQRKSHLQDSFVPDVSFTAKESIPKDWNIAEPFPGVPTLAVEIASPSDNAFDLAAKMRKYLELGTAEAWVLFPQLRELHQYRRNTPQTVRVYRDPAEHIETPLLPGLDLTLAQIFEMPDWS